ncbi:MULTISPECIES: hypothetical protein [unclassified Streptomyces]|uniref:hypothetical protein n=1 Tax=unclassified Streptomyces TaxID=2593676 RepID=UPI0035DA3C8E
MALVKKGSRLITVDDTIYRWRLRERPTYDRTALAAGWMPENPGSPFHLDQSAGFVSSC